jgi:hypothetical protein
MVNNELSDFHPQREGKSRIGELVAHFAERKHDCILFDDVLERM